MTIAIHISSRLKNDFFLNCFLKFANINKDDHFILISDGKFNISKHLPDNCTPVSLEPLIKNQLLKYYWYNFKLPSILNRYNADVYFSPVFAASLKSKVPAVIFLNEINGSSEADINASNLKYMRFAKYICSTNPVQLQNIKIKYPFLSTKLIDIPFPVNSSYKTLSYEAREILNEKFSNGNDHFTTIISSENKEAVITLLKAFSIFKKWQKSSFELIIINKTKNEKILPQLESYKYREAVHIIQFKERDEKDIISSGYAFFDLSNISTGKEFVLKAMHCGVPVISTIQSKNVFEEAVFYSEATDKSLSEKMMVIYKDELLRNKIIELGNQFALANSENKMLESIKNITEMAIGQTS